MTKGARQERDKRYFDGVAIGAVGKVVYDWYKRCTVCHLAGASSRKYKTRV